MGDPKSSALIAALDRSGSGANDLGDAEEVCGFAVTDWVVDEEGRELSVSRWKASGCKFWTMGGGSGGGTGWDIFQQKWANEQPKHDLNRTENRFLEGKEESSIEFHLLPSSKQHTDANLFEIAAAGVTSRIIWQKSEYECANEEGDNDINNDLEGQHGDISKQYEKLRGSVRFYR